jgi:hypothetical protein
VGQQHFQALKLQQQHQARQQTQVTIVTYDIKMGLAVALGDMLDCSTHADIGCSGA